jgi:hypothetical protein
VRKRKSYLFDGFVALNLLMTEIAYSIHEASLWWKIIASISMLLIFMMLYGRPIFYDMHRLTQNQASAFLVMCIQ